MTDSEDLQFPINHALLEEASRIKHERTLIRERIAKIEAKKNDVSPSVYQKVKQDYQAKLNEVTNALLEKKTDIDRELSTLYETRKRVTDNLEQHKEALEEMKFRADLGEYDDKEYKEISNSEKDKISKFEKVLSAVTNNIERYEAIFADEEGIFDSTEPSLKRAKVKPEQPITPHAIGEESEYIIGEENKDYFSPDTEESHTPASTGEITKKNTIPSGEAKLVCIEGDIAGSEFKLKKETTIGRANNNTIVLKDAKVSRQHSVIKQTGQEFVIIDLNSSNGVIVNHEKIKEHVLSDGDQIIIGDHTLQVKF